MNDSQYAFAAGLLCASTIDFLARIEFRSNSVGTRVERWLTKNIPAFCQPDPQVRSRNLARRFGEEFRNGLVHEGRIKNAGQSSYDYDDIVTLEAPVMIVNPHRLENAIASAIATYLARVKQDGASFQAFRRVLRRDFQEDVRIAQTEG